ncbi:MAG: GspH/FimT family protein [Trueperaceae bacterium]
MRRSIQGFSLLELIMACAIVGIILSAGFVQMNPSGTATRQTAEVVAATINRARFEAIRTNNTAGFEVVAGSGGGSGTVTVCRNVDETVALNCSTGEIAESIDFSDDDLGRAVISQPTSLTVFFDRRGIVRNPGSNQTILITDQTGGNQRTVTISPTGRTEVN